MPRAVHTSKASLILSKHNTNFVSILIHQIEIDVLYEDLLLLIVLLRNLLKYLYIRSITLTAK